MTFSIGLHQVVMVAQGAEVLQGVIIAGNPVIDLKVRGVCAPSTMPAFGHVLPGAAVAIPFEDVPAPLVPVGG